MQQFGEINLTTWKKMIENTKDGNLKAVDFDCFKNKLVKILGQMMTWLTLALYFKSPSQ